MDVGKETAGFIFLSFSWKFACGSMRIGKTKFQLSVVELRADSNAVSMEK